MACRFIKFRNDYSQHASGILVTSRTLGTVGSSMYATHAKIHVHVLGTLTGIASVSEH